MSININHPGTRHHIPVLPTFAALAIVALVTISAFQLSGAFSGTDHAPVGPAVEVPALDQGPNFDLAPDWTAQVPTLSVTALDRGPNDGLAPDWTQAPLAPGAVDRGPNVGLPPDLISQQAAANAAAD